MIQVLTYTDCHHTSSNHSSNVNFQIVRDFQLYIDFTLRWRSYFKALIANNYDTNACNNCSRSKMKLTAKLKILRKLLVSMS